jgi:peptide-methionine (S)-S-oxide reductase
MRQGNDVGTRYRSGIYYTYYTYYTDDTEEAEVEASRVAYQAALTAAGRGKITTAVAPLSGFYYAEEYHQQYLHKVPNGYCGPGGSPSRPPVTRRRSDVLADPVRCRPPDGRP